MRTQRLEKRVGEHVSARERQRDESARTGDREIPGPLAPLFICFFLPLGLPYVNLASQECCLFYLRSSDLLLFYFQGLFPFLSLSHHHSGLLFPTLTTKQI